MFNDIQSLQNNHLPYLFSDSSIYLISKRQYEQYILLIEKYDALFNTLPFFSQDTPYLYDTGRDLFFYLSNKPNQLLEDSSHSLIYLVRSTLLILVTKSDSFKKTMNFIKQDTELSFIYSTMLMDALWKFHNEAQKVERIYSEIQSTLLFKNIDLRSLFSEKHLSIEPYPKKIARLQQKLAKLYIKLAKEKPQSFEGLIEQSGVDFLSYLEIYHFTPKGDV